MYGSIAIKKAISKNAALILFVGAVVGAISQASLSQASTNQKANGQSLKSNSSKIISSEDGRLQFTLKQKSDKLRYTVTFAGQELIGESALGYRVKRPNSPAINLADNIQAIVDQGDVSNCEASTIEPSCRQYSFTISSKHSGKTYDLGFQLRLFNDGLAFRYQPKLEGVYQILGDSSSFRFPPKTLLWHQDNIRSSSYEGQFGLSIIEAIKPEQVIRLPITAQFDGDKYVSISEANLLNDSGLQLRKAKQGLALEADFYDESWPASKNHSSAWRFISVAQGLDQLVNTHMVERLSKPAEPTLFADKSYLKPGVALWHWLPEGKYGAKPERQRQYIDAAAEMGFAYSLIDDGWARFFPEADARGDKYAVLKTLSDYAASKGVGLWMWMDVKDVADAKARGEIFSKLHALGVVGIKVDFFDTQYGDSESYAAVKAYQEILTDAAKSELMVNFHGASKPTGLEITYPNEMTREAVRGQEYEHRRGWINAKHNSILPFTRYLLGAGDYTPVRFNPTKLASSHSTATHQLALAGLLQSNVQNFSFSPENIEVLKTENPAVLDYLKQLPVVWDESRVVEGSAIGAMVMIAKRKGQDWYLFAIDGDYTPESGTKKHYKLSPGQLNFLSDKKYSLDVWTDENRFKVAHSHKKYFKLRKGLKLDYVNAGGFILKFAAR